MSVSGTVTNVAMNSYSDAVSGGTNADALGITSIPDWTKKLRRTDTPLLKMIGGIKAGAAPSQPELKARWGWSLPAPTKDQLAEALDNSETGVDVDHGNYFQVGDVLRVDEEHMYVQSISSNTLTVLRGFRGTAAAIHSDDAPVYIISPAIMENQDDPLSPIIQGEDDYNYPHIMIWSWQFSQRARVTHTWESKNFAGMRDAQELKKKMGEEAPVDLERTLIEGLRWQGVPGSTPSTMGGILQPSYITTQEDLSGDPLTEFDMLEALQTAYRLVGMDAMAKTAMTGTIGKRIVNSWYNDTRRTSGGDSKISVKWNEIDTDFGVIRFVLNYQLDELGRSDHMFFLNTENLTLRPYHTSTGWQTGSLATQGWYTHGFLRGDFTLICRNADEHVLLSGFSTTPTDYPSYV